MNASVRTEHLGAEQKLPVEIRSLDRIHVRDYDTTSVPLAARLGMSEWSRLPRRDDRDDISLLRARTSLKPHVESESAANFVNLASGGLFLLFFAFTLSSRAARREDAVMVK